MNKERKVALGLLIPFALIIFLFQFLPFVSVLLGSFQKNGSFSLGNYYQIIESKFLRQAISNSIEISIYSTILGVIIAFCGAFSLHKIKENTKKGYILLINMISNFNGVPLAFALIILLGMNGIITLTLKEIGIKTGFNLFKKEGLILMYTYFQIPLGILLLYPSFSKLNKECEEMVYILGGSKIIYWRKIGLPMMIPELSGTILILFANAMGAYASTLALTGGNFNMITIRVTSYVAGETVYDPNLASALALILALILVIATLANELLIKRGRNYGK